MSSTCTDELVIFTHIHVAVMRLLTMVILVLPMSVSWSKDQTHQWFSFLTLLEKNAGGDWGSSMEANISDSCLLTRCDADEKWRLYKSILNQASAQLLPSEITIVSKQILNNLKKQQQNHHKTTIQNSCPTICSEGIVIYAK